MRKCATLIGEDVSQKGIADTMKLSKYEAYRLLHRLIDAGYAREHIRSSTKFYKLTRSGREFVSTKGVAQLPHGMKERIIRGSHDLFLKYPIANPEDASKITKSFWNKSWNPGNGVKRCKYIDRPVSMTITINQGCKSLSAQIHDFTVHNNLTVHTRIFKISWNLYNLFGKRFGVLLDIDRMSVQNEEKTYEDADSRKLAAQGKKFKVMLGRNCEKYTEYDPDRQAWVELCRTPNDNWETDDRAHDVRRALMPEKIHAIEEEVHKLAESIMGYMPNQLATTNAVNYSAAAMKRLEEHAGRQTEILGRLAERTSAPPVVSGPTPQGERRLDVDSGPRPAAPRPLERYIGPSAHKNIGIRVIKGTPGFGYTVGGEELRVRPKMPGAEIWLPEDIAREIIRDGYAEEIPDE